MKDLMTIVSATMIGLVAFVIYLSYAAKFLFFAALIYLTYAFFKSSLAKHGDKQRPGSMRMDDAGLPVT